MDCWFIALQAEWHKHFCGGYASAGDDPHSLMLMVLFAMNLFQ
jgi:hypothetical protein